MISGFAVPQLGQVIVDFRITDITSRVEEPEDNQDRPNGQNACHERCNSRPPTSGTGGAHGRLATTPEQHAATTQKTGNGDGSYRRILVMA